MNKWISQRFSFLWLKTIQEFLGVEHDLKCSWHSQTHGRMDGRYQRYYDYYLPPLVSNADNTYVRPITWSRAVLKFFILLLIIIYGVHMWWLVKQQVEDAKDAIDEQWREKTRSLTLSILHSSKEIILLSSSSSMPKPSCLEMNTLRGEYERNFPTLEWTVS